VAPSRDGPPGAGPDGLPASTRVGDSGDTAAGPALNPRERRLKRATVVLAMLLATAVLVIAGILLYWSIYLIGPSDSPFSRGPYLLRVDEREARLRWRVDDGQEVRVVALDPAGQAVEADGERLTGLRPGTRYAWTASIDGRAWAAGSFTTPHPDPGRPVRFSVLADYGAGSDPQYAVARTITATRPQFVLTAGDNSHISAPDFLLNRNIFRPMAELMRNAPVYIGLGDHDQLPPGDGDIREAFDVPPAGRYVLRQGPIQVVVLGNDASGGGVEFARRALAEPGFTRRFVVVHKPLRAGNPVLPVLRAGDVDAVFSGNLHLYERRTVEGVRTFTVGTGGTQVGAAEFTPRSADADLSREVFGHLMVDVTADSVTYLFVDESGRVIDRTRTR
jgi:hypothetical protein